VRNFRLNRRALLLGGGGVLVGLPVLDAMLPRTARAQSATAPKRLVVFYTPNGTNAGNSGEIQNQTAFWPAATGSDFVLGEEVAALEPLRDKLLIVSGINGPSMEDNVDSAFGDLHSIGMSQMLTGTQYIYDPATAVGDSLPGGYPGDISVDQYIASQIGSATRFPSLELGVMTATDSGVMPFSRMISSGPNQPVPPEEDPAAAFTRIFSDGTDTGGETVDYALQQRKSVLDYVMEDYTRISSNVGAADKQRLEAHLDQVRALEMRLGGGGGMPMPTQSCDSTTAIENPGDPQDKANFPAIGKLHMDVLALALKCDMTRVASLQWSWARSTLVHTWVGASEGHHSMSHFGSTAPLTAVNAWYAEQLAYFGQALDAVDDVDGKTLLDNTLVYWCSDVAWAYTHSFINLRGFFLGSCGGAMKTGQHIAVSAQPHQKLLVTLMQAMGLSDNEFGDSSYGTGPLDGILA
jgi:hypothetical protein